MTGGSSVFADSFKAAKFIKMSNPAYYHELCTFPVTYHYRNAGEHYHFKRPVVELEPAPRDKIARKNMEIANINWSPPFQGPFEEGVDTPNNELGRWLSAAKSFSDWLQSPAHQYEMTLKEGDCVIFNNRRVLHARREFDSMSGDRWLKGAYVDADAFHSRVRVLSEKFKPINRPPFMRRWEENAVDEYEGGDEHI